MDKILQIKDKIFNLILNFDLKQINKLINSFFEKDKQIVDSEIKHWIEQKNLEVERKIFEFESLSLQRQILDSEIELFEAGDHDVFYSLANKQEADIENKKIKLKYNF